MCVCVSVYKRQHFHGCRLVIVFVVIVVVFFVVVVSFVAAINIVSSFSFCFDFHFVTLHGKYRAGHFQPQAAPIFNFASFGFGFSVISNTAKQTKHNSNNNNIMFYKPGTQNFICVSLALFSQVPESTLKCGRASSGQGSQREERRRREEGTC